MATESLRRRHWLAAAAALAAAPSWAAQPPQRRLLAAWQHADQQHVGLLRMDGRRLVVGAQLEVPTRAHGLVAEPGGTVLAVARRPGDWLLRWTPRTGHAAWHWIDGDRRFNGHVVRSGKETLWTTETDLASGQGLIGVRDAASLEKTEEWRTRGLDPHQLLALPEPLGRFPAGTLVVANGGIATLPETGRVKHDLQRMDPSLVALDPRSGALLGQWRLDDRFLSIRHLAWEPRARRLGIALQAEHAQAPEREAAPVFASWDGEVLAAARGQPRMQGYGGDICPHPGGGFIVSCPRADALAVFAADGQFLRTLRHPLAYALAQSAGAWWSSGREAALAVGRTDTHLLDHPSTPAASWQFDNHWQVAPAV